MLSCFCVFCFFPYLPLQAFVASQFVGCCVALWVGDSGLTCQRRSKFGCGFRNGFRALGLGKDSKRGCLVTKLEMVYSGERYGYKSLNAKF